MSNTCEKCGQVLPASDNKMQSNVVSKYVEDESGKMFGNMPYSDEYVTLAPSALHPNGVKLRRHDIHKKVPTTIPIATGQTGKTVTMTPKVPQIPSPTT